MDSIHRGRRGKLISGTASAGKSDPSGFNEKSPNGNFKSGSASNPQSSGSLVQGVRSSLSCIRAICKSHILTFFPSDEFCQRCVLGCEVFFFFFIPFANLIPRSKSSFSVSDFHKLGCLVCSYEAVGALLCPVLLLAMSEVFTCLQ